MHTTRPTPVPALLAAIHRRRLIDQALRLIVEADRTSGRPIRHVFNGTCGGNGPYRWGH